MKDGVLSIEFFQRLAKGLAAQFGSNCEVVLHDMSTENTILLIENGHITNRKVGDGPSHVVLDAMKADKGMLQDHVGYLTKTHDGRILKSTTIYVRDDDGAVVGILSINYDITGLMMADSAIKSIISHEEDEQEPSNIPQNVNELLDELIDSAVHCIGKPVAMMSKDEKKSAIQYLNNAGAFLILKSGDRVSQHFGISKATLYSYIDAKQQD